MSHVIFWFLAGCLYAGVLWWIEQPLRRHYTKVSTPSASHNTQRAAIIAEAVDAWREWSDGTNVLLSNRLINSMDSLTELYPQ